MVLITWLSIDPVRRKVDFYPKAIAARIEKCYKDSDRWVPTACVLGKDFFNATITFHPSGSCYQTTPGLSMGRTGFKQPGYRSVKRYIIEEDNTNHMYTIFSQQIRGEWRLSINNGDTGVASVAKLEDVIPENCIIDSDYVDTISYSITAWKPEYLHSNSLDTNVVVWQWCKGTRENQGNIMALSNEWWIPYLYEQNIEIETAFNREECEANIHIPVSNTIRKIVFQSNTCFATQRDTNNRKVRCVRRVIITVQELKEMLNRRATFHVDPTILTNITDPDTIPHEFYCCISQNIMTDPVKTIDGFTYDRSSIERWFSDHDTSPLTGLRLASTALEPNIILREQIEKYTCEKVALLNISNSET